jgi:hypothetical protein
MLGVEAKRPTSLRRLDDALRDAAGQLERFPGTRLVAIQLDHALRPPKGWFHVQRDWQLLERTKQAYEWFIDQYGHLAFKRCLPKGVTAVLYSLTSPGWVHGINAPSVFNASFFHVLTDRDSHAYRAVREWAETIGKRLD